MAKGMGWLGYGKCADGRFVVEETRFLLLGSAAEAQAHADALMKRYNADPAHASNPIVRAWAQFVDPDATLSAVEPAPDDSSETDR